MEVRQMISYLCIYIAVELSNKRDISGIGRRGNSHLLKTDFPVDTRRSPDISFVLTQLHLFGGDNDD